MKKKPQIVQLDEVRTKRLQPLARRIVDHLMTVYHGKRKPLKRGTRLAIMRSLGKPDTGAGPEENLGGLCKDAAIERVLEVLVRYGKDQ
ncbi:MAG: hypothetical protein LLG01_00880 [Planctomycetaceae bacterium]|nr:hypothetical protein [Planctomycetaceae bacterium]